MNQANENQSGYRHTKVGWIPNDWEVRELGELGKPMIGLTYTPDDVAEDGTLVLRSSNIQGGKLAFEDNVYVKSAVPERARVRAGDILICVRNGSRSLIGKCALVTPDRAGDAFGAFMSVFRAEKDAFIFYQFQAHEIRRQIHKTLGATINQITSADLKRFQIAIPSDEAELEKIAEILGTWDQGILKLEKLISVASGRKRSLMQQLLSGEKRLPGFTEEWQEVRFGEILDHVFRPVEWAPDKIFNLVSIRRRSGGFFRRDPVRGDGYKTKDLHEIRSGDFLISKRQVSHGALAMVRDDFHECHVSKEYTILVNKNPERLYMPFFDWLSRTRRMWWMTFVASNGVVKEKLIFAPKDFLKFEIKLPPTVGEQERIVDVLEACDRELALHRRWLDAMREQKRGLMQKLLTGEVRVNTGDKI